MAWSSDRGRVSLSLAGESGPRVRLAVPACTCSRSTVRHTVLSTQDAAPSRATLRERVGCCDRAVSEPRASAPHCGFALRASRSACTAEASSAGRCVGPQAPRFHPASPSAQSLCSSGPRISPLCSWSPFTSLCLAAVSRGLCPLPGWLGGTEPRDRPQAPPPSPSWLTREGRAQRQLLQFTSEWLPLPGRFTPQPALLRGTCCVWPGSAAGL